LVEFHMAVDRPKFSINKTLVEIRSSSVK
jgi:hypothetical protein